MARPHQRLLLALIALFVAAGCGPDPVSPLQNLVIICIDTVRFDVFEALDEVGGDAFSAWSERALDFEAALSTAPWTVPAVASALTGQTPNRHGAGAFRSPVAHLGKTVPNRLSSDVATLPELLSPHGFESVAIVAHTWFKTRFGLDRGFESVTLVPTGSQVVRGAEKWFERRAREEGAKRFFLYLHFMDAHAHLSWTLDDKRKRAGLLTPAQREAAVAVAPSDWCERPQGRRCRSFLAYVQAVSAQREYIAQVLASLEDRGLLPQTAVVLYADHGEEFHDHLEQGRAIGGDPRGKYGFGHGHAMFQEVLHVPLMAWHPAHEGRRLGMRVSLADVVPSALDWLGVELLEQAFDGVSWLDAVAGRDDRNEHPLFASAIAFGPQQVSVVRGDWKRIVHLAGGERSLYDLASDPGEESPLERSSVESELDALFDEYVVQTRKRVSDAPQLSPEEIRRLQSLGYLEDAITP